MGALPARESHESRMISAELVKSERIDTDTNKLLLLGTGNTGKTTFFRQFRLLNNDTFTDREREGYCDLIRSQIILGMCSLAIQCKQRHDEGEPEYQLSDEGYKMCTDLCQQVRNQSNGSEMCIVKHLWSEYAITNLFYSQDDRRRMIAPPVPETCEHFWNKIDCIMDEGYVPTDEDLILLRSPTTGSSTYRYEYETQKFMITDIGGQRSERRKWLNVFNNVEALLYVVSLSAYDEVLAENAYVNAMQDQLEQFESVINLDVFAQTTVILFLNKKDLLERKLADGRSIRMFFEEYDGDDSFDSSVAYIKSQFFARDKNGERDIFVHVTHATDNENAQRVLRDVTKSIIRESMVRNGIISRKRT